MPANDAIHDAVRNALVKDGWTITGDPYTIKYGRDKLYADLAAEKVIAADRGVDRIAVEVKSILGRRCCTTSSRHSGSSSCTGR